MTTTSSDDPAALPVGAQVMLRPLANPLPLGFLVLGAATLLLSGVQLQWLPPEDATTVAVILLVFVAPLQLLASVLGFLARDPVAGTGMGILAGTWAAVGFTTLRSPLGTTSHALGLLLLVSATAMLVPARWMPSRRSSCLHSYSRRLRFASYSPASTNFRASRDGKWPAA